MKIDKRIKWTDNQKTFLRFNYPIIDNKILSEILNKSTKTICAQAKVLELHKILPRHFINHNFFDTWSEPMAYILGFTMADGCIRKDRNEVNYRVKRTDRCIIEYIANQIMQTTNYIKDGKTIRNNTICYYSHISISSKNIINKLLNYNIISAKTGKEKLCNIPDNFKSDYLRGLFDGDGCITINDKKGNLRFSICSASENFLKDVQSLLGFGYGHIRKNEENCYIWNVNKSKHIKYLSDFIYHKNHSFSLERKRIKFNLLGNNKEE